MPALGRNKRNPKELRGVYNANKFVNKMNLVSNKSSGIIGTPIGDAEGFEKTINSFETLENNLEAYVPAVQKQFVAPIVKPSAEAVLVSLKVAERNISKISLMKLPLSAVETLLEYKGRMDAYEETLIDLRNRMDGVLPGFSGTEEDLTTIADKLSVISQTIQAQINIYNSGVSQPVKFGAGFNPNSPMYQTQEYIYPRFL